MNSDTGSERDIPTASFSDAVENSTKPTTSMRSLSDTVPDQDPSSPPGPTDTDVLLRELFAYTVNWAKRFYHNRQSHDRQKIVEFVSRALVPDARSPATSIPDQIHEFMVTHLHQGLTLKELSEFLGYSEKYCSDFFILHMGEPFTVYSKGLRLQTAKLLLKNSNQNLTQIAQAVGFQDQFSFSHFFKKAAGLSPRQFRDSFPMPGSQT